ncbi:DUF262 domain-containing protein [Flavobacterium sp. PL02]|uniref:DUF262 domain-containing protein n=1 Tax=Flavobacterium sp. PL02 TaxID=3088354 RepID=UPI002B22C91D|nr:DUF262 domain-containing protein [Flavobacterium sp. PL02]MEA9412668.1 DUF262 domain-containing protein [Flavobacterium sp. PL02]
MNNEICLKSISELLEESFYISSYQRGYRWTEQQIFDLLNDIYSFAKKKNKSEKEFYCLQPIIVKKHSWVRISNDQEETIVGWDVVDGQQRLTTIRILFKYLLNEFLTGRSLKQRYNKDLFTIEYQTRPQSYEFLDNPEKEDHSNIDFYHISEAYKFIAKWFNQKVESDGLMFDDLCDSITKLLVYNKTNQKEEGVVQVIWYQLADEQVNQIATFIRINLGKISLTNSELIKALFLQERNFGVGDAAKLKQLEIAHEWDQIENFLQDENFWWFLNKSNNEASSHIEFIFDMICEIAVKNNDEIAKLLGNDKFVTFRYFNLLFGDDIDYLSIKHNWDTIKKYFETFVEWYENPIWYHYIGFLVYCGESVLDIFNLLTAPEIENKEDVTIALVKQIKNKHLKGISWIEKTDDNNEKTFELNLGYNSDKYLLRKTFLLFNLEYIVKKTNQQNLIYKFPFKAFKANKKIKDENTAWDIEHIDSATENSLTKKEDQNIWLENALIDVPEISKDAVLLGEINNFITNQIGDFDQLFKKAQVLSNEEELTDELKNSLGNLTLLDAGTNRGYGNALFVSKRRIIIEKDKEGVFIPICTKNVFLKYFDGNTKGKWITEDIIAYRKEIENTLQKFLPTKKLTI